MHRNTLLLTSVFAVIAALLVGTRIGMKLQPAPPAISMPTVTLAPSAKPTTQVSLVTYTDKACDLSVQYPNNLQILESTDSGTILADPVDVNKSIVIVCQTDIPRVPLPPDKIESLTLMSAKGASVSAKLYHDASQKDGTLVDKLIFTHPKSGLDVFIAGYGAVFDRIISSLKLQ